MDFTDFSKQAGNFSSGVGSISSALSSVLSSGGLFKSIGSLFGSRSAERRAFQRQKDLMAYSSQLQDEIIRKQNEYNLDSWMKQNEYNSPVNQMARLKAAGLNSNLVYGGDGSVAGNAEGIQSGSGVSLNSNTDSKLLSGLMSRQSDLALLAQMKQNALVDSQIDLNDANAQSALAQAGLSTAQAITQRAQRSDLYASVYQRLADTAYKRYALVRDKVKDPQVLENLKAEYENLQSLADKYSSETRLNQQSYDFNEDMNPKLLKSKDKEIEEYGKKIQLLGQEINNAIKLGKNIDAQTAAYQAQAADLLAAAGLKRKEAEKLAQELKEMQKSWAFRFSQIVDEGQKAFYDSLVSKYRSDLERKLSSTFAGRLTIDLLERVAGIFMGWIPLAPGVKPSGSSINNN